MTRLISSEIFKLRTTRTFLGLTVGPLVLLLLIVIPVTAFVHFHTGDRTLHGLLVFPSFLRIFALLLGILTVTSEFRHGTITPTLLVEPDRLRLVLAKLCACVLVAVALGLVSTGSVTAIGAGIFSLRNVDFGPDPAVVKLIVGGSVGFGLYAALGLGIGAVVRNQVGAIIGSLVYLFVVESALLLVPGVKDEVPTYGLTALMNAVSGFGEHDDKDLLGQVPAGLVLAGYAAVFLIAGVLLLRRRDVSA
jgi:ABC-2 type transport system permease protein